MGLRRCTTKHASLQDGWDSNDIGWYVCVVFILNRSFYPSTSVHPVSVLILHPREIQITWSQTETEKTKAATINQVKQVKC